MEDWIKKRKDWSTARDAAGAKKGAVKGISLGDELDKVGKAQKLGYAAFAAAVKKLQATSAKYVAGLPKGSDKVKAWIKTNIDSKADDDLAAAAADLKSMAWIEAELLNDNVAYIAGAHPDSGRLRNISALMDKTPGLSWEDAAKDIGIFQIPSAVLAKAVPRLAALSKLAWKAALPGHEADYKTVADYVAPFRSDIVFYGKWVKVTTADEFLAFMKASGARENSHSSFDRLRNAMNALKA